MREFFGTPNVDWIGKKWYLILFSFVLSGAGIVSLIVKGGPRYGIDFKGGTLVDAKFKESPSLERIRSALAAEGLGQSTLQRYGAEEDNEILIGLDLEATSEEDADAGRRAILAALNREFGGGEKPNWNQAGAQAIMERLSTASALASLNRTPEQWQQLAADMVAFRDGAPRRGLIASFEDLRQVPGVTPEVVQALSADFVLPGFVVRGVEIVGPRVGATLRRQAMNATLLALAAMLVYIAVRFEWSFGLAATVTTFHDVVIAVGLMSLANMEISLTVIAALLTLVGYSVNDTIVVFDRIRENMKLMRRDSMTTIANASINQTLSRTILTGGATFASVLALYLFGGEVLKGFAFVLVVGILVGTYSSIAVGSTLVVSWNEYFSRAGKGGKVVPIERAQSKPKGPRVSAGVKA